MLKASVVLSVLALPVQYKSTDTDLAIGGPQGLPEDASQLLGQHLYFCTSTASKLSNWRASGASRRVQPPVWEASVVETGRGTQFTCFTGTKVQILTHLFRSQIF